jgi:hypothetical protein
MGDPSAADVFAAMATDRVLDERARVSAAQSLTEVEPKGHSPRLTAVLVKLVLEPDLPETAREEAFRLLDRYLGRAGQDRREVHHRQQADDVVDLLSQVVNGREYSRRERAWATMAMRRLAGSRSPTDSTADGPGAHHTRMHGARILALGAAYKPGTADARQSPAVQVIERLRAMGADVTVVDPHLPDGGCRDIPFAAADADTNVADFDAVVLLTAHGEFDLTQLAAEAAYVLDTRGLMASAPHVERL